MQIIIDKPYAIHEIGKRNNNEDCIYPEKDKATENNRFFIVCDGMGGHQNGEIASNIVCKSITSFLSANISDEFNKDLFQKALNHAYDQLDAINDNGDIDKKTGTTLAFLYFHNEGAFMAHIGDSRIYQLRKTDSETSIIYKSEDHSYVNDLVKSGIITAEEATTHSQRNIITRAIQPHQGQRNQADFYMTNDVQPGDCFFLCTDGILEQINDNLLCIILNEDIKDEEKNRAILEICQKGSKDNFSSYLISIANVINDKQETKKKNNNKKFFILFSFIITVTLAILLFPKNQEIKTTVVHEEKFRDTTKQQVINTENTSQKKDKILNDKASKIKNESLISTKQNKQTDNSNISHPNNTLSQDKPTFNTDTLNKTQQTQKFEP